jgi:hypothetical protein
MNPGINSGKLSIYVDDVLNAKTKRRIPDTSIIPKTKRKKEKN